MTDSLVQTLLRHQLVRFFIVGAGCAVLDLGLTLTLQYGALCPEWQAKAAGYVLGTVVAYMVNRRWTFAAVASRRRFAQVMVLYGVTFLLQEGIYTVLSRMLPEAIVVSVGIFIIAQTVATLVNFVVQKLFLFKVKK